MCTNNIYYIAADSQVSESGANAATMPTILVPTIKCLTRTRDNQTPTIMSLTFRPGCHRSAIADFLRRMESQERVTVGYAEFVLAIFPGYSMDSC